MSDIPDDPWAALLVGHQWPGAPALATVSAAAASRQTVGTSFHGYADTLRSIADTVLSDQEGHAAEGIRASFRDGEDHARAVAERNAAKHAALVRAHRSASELRSALAEIAEHGSGRIRAIIESTQPAPAKIAAIVHVVQTAHADADTRAALCVENVYGSVQHVLDTSGHQASARQFAHRHGVSGSLHRAPHPDVLYQQVQQLFEKHYSAASSPTPSPPSRVPFEERIAPAVAPVIHSPAGQSAMSVAPPARNASAPAVRTLSPSVADVRPAVSAARGAPISAPPTAAPAPGPTTAAAVIARAAGPAVVERARPSIGPVPELLALLHAVARQEPALRWAIGVTDARAVLATDLASGWIPPHIDIPAELVLLEPAVRDGDLTEWFGPDASVITHRPGGPLAPVGDPIPVRSRAGLQVDDLGWKLMQATRWRDGLTRMSNTATKAAAAGLDLLPAEVNQLARSLDTVAERVLGGYPTSANAAELGNWQLLASIVSLVNREIDSAHYHFAWFESRNSVEG